MLAPVIADVVYRSPKRLVDWVDRFGSPLNIVWPDILKKNVATFRAVQRRHGVRFDIFYGAKVNKSRALVQAAVEAGVGVDVSSEYEMRDALLAGALGSMLCATGPAKTERFHRALIAAGALISVDSLEEFAELRQLAGATYPACKVRMLLRYRPASAAASRFGMSADDCEQCLRALAEMPDKLAFEGFHFHLGGYGHESRAQAVRDVADQIDKARLLGLNPRMVDIGGGLPIRYVDSIEYEAFVRSQRADHYRNAKVPASFYPYGSPIDFAEWLDLLLETPCRDSQPIARYLNLQGLTLAIEPGRSLVDQAAISVFRITRTKALADGNHVIFVEGSSFSACETWFASEFLIDPIHVTTGHSKGTSSAPARGYIAGHSCLDDDVITNRFIRFETTPRTGDLLVYANTAGYQMDLLENEFHRHPMPRRIAVRCGEAGGMDVTPDDDKGVDE